jgi:PAS domain S-box-containing protein
LEQHPPTNSPKSHAGDQTRRDDHYRRQLQAVANNATLALFILDERQYCTYMNPAAERMTGFTLAEVQGLPLHDIIHHTRPDGTPYPLSECPIDQAFPKNMRETGEEVFVHKDGSFYPVAFTASPVLDDGRPVGTIIEVRNISAEKQAAREAALTVAIGAALTQGGALRQVLQRSAEAVAEHLDAAFARIWTLNETEQVLELQASAGMYTHLDGAHGKVPVGAYKIGLIAQEQKPHLTNDVPNDPRISARQWAADEGMIAFAGYPLLVDGRTVGVLAMFARHTLSERTLSALGAVADGIALAIARHLAADERERVLQELAIERTRLTTVFEEAPAFIATLRGRDHVFQMANPPYRQLVGHRELIGRTVRDALPEIEGQGFFELLDGVFETGQPFVGTELPVSVQREPGGALQELVVNFVYQPLIDATGAVEGILVHGVDVTDMVLARRLVEEQASELELQAEELQHRTTLLEEIQVELEAANDELTQNNAEVQARVEEADEARAVIATFYEAAPVPTALVDRDLRFQRANRALAAFYGLEPDAVIGRKLSEVAPQYADRVEPYYRHVLETGEPVRNLELVVPSHIAPVEDRHFVVNYFPVRVHSNEVIGVGVVALDVTERRQVEEAQREQTALVETIQRVGRSITSELNIDSIVQEVTDAATALTGAQFGAFFYNVLNENGESYMLYTISGVSREAFANFPMPRNTQIFDPTFRGSGVVRSDDITKDPRYGKMAPYHGMPSGHLPVTSYLAVPVISRTGDVIGGLFFGHAEAGRFMERHERLAEGIAGWAAVALDNAQLYRAEHLARAEAERANRAKGDFLATMSHELRTPLNAMIGYADLLLAGIPVTIPESARQKVDRIGVSARHLLELIEEILSFSRLEAGEEKLEVDTVDPVELVGELQALMEPLALAKGINFECHAPVHAKPMHSDARKIRQVLINLVGNAIKFTPQGKVQLVLEEADNEVLFHVHDTGPGIPEEYVERIFEPFWQVEGGPTRTAGGTGLGLTVTRRLARLLGGDVTVTTELNKGTEFVVRLPSNAPAPVPADE